ncbi:MAG: histidinol-phosphate transaminase [Deltaproteobacteria bacterium]|nr:histidinol-phosphate transaminase [Deltaproteobacteria bacterium]
MALVSENIETLFPYVPGKPIEETERELGISGVAKLASNENALGPSPKAVAAVQEGVRSAHLYPDGSCYYLKNRLAEHLDVSPEELVVGNGSNEVIVLLVRTFLQRAGSGAVDHEAIISDGSFIVYRLALQAHGVKTVRVPLGADRRFDLDAMAAAITPATRMIFIANPNNPTGTYVGRAAMEAFLKKVPEEVIVVLDEAYTEYVEKEDYPDGLQLRKLHPRVVVLRTFSKIHGLAALRVGYGVMSAELASYLNRVRDPFNVGALGQLAARAALDDPEHASKSRALNSAELARLEAALPGLGVTVTPSVCNFVLCDFGREGKGVYEALLHEGIIVRPMAGYGFTESARITVGLPGENERLLAALKKVL